jgi:iron(III) transport system substrate-binding protein
MGATRATTTTTAPVAACAARGGWAALGLLLTAVVLTLGACTADPGAGGPGTTGGEPGAGDDAAESPGDGAPGTPADGTGEAEGDGVGGAAADEGPLTVYSGRNEELVGPLFAAFTDSTGIEVNVRYGDSAELAATILEEGERSPADVYFAQDAGALGALADEDRLARLPGALLEPVEARFRSTDDTWVGVSGRARTVVFHTGTLTRDDVPDSVLDLTDERWAGRVGWAPTNGSFQAFVTAMRVELGDERTRDWLEGMVANDARAYDNNMAIVEAVGRGEIELGLANHYYLYRFLEEDPGFEADNAFLGGGDVGGLVNVAGVGVLATTEQPAAAEELVAFLLSEEAQRHFSQETYEYPLVQGIPADDRLPPLEEITTPDLDLADLEDLRGTLELLRQAGTLS